MDNIMIIEKPRIVKHDGFADLVTKVILPNGSMKNIWYRTDEKWGEYFVTENADAFLVNVIYYAMWNGFDIKMNTPVSPELLYQLKEHYIPLMAKTKPFFQNISIFADVDTMYYVSQGVAATGISCGVDSFYTIFRHLNLENEDFNIKYVLFQDWFSIGLDDMRKRKWRSVFAERTMRVANELGLNYIYLSCNIDEQLPTPPVNDKYYGLVTSKGLYTYKYCSAALALGKLINKYYFSSGYDIEHFDLKPSGNVFDEDHYSLFNIYALSTSNVRFYHFGGDVTRIEKLDFIAQFDIARKNLSVCSDEENCGKCPKCIRTMGELYSINKLNMFEDCFPIPKFKKHIIKNFSLIIINSNNDFFAEILEKCKKNNIKVPRLSYCYAPIQVILIKTREITSKINWMKKIYRKYFKYKK